MVRTKEQLEAAQELQSIAPGLQVQFDPEGWPVIRGQRGRIEYHDGKELAVYTDRPKLFRKLFAIPGVRRHQTGDIEVRALFPPAALSQVALLIGRRIRAHRPLDERPVGGEGRMLRPGVVWDHQPSQPRARPDPRPDERRATNIPGRGIPRHPWPSGHSKVCFR